MTETLTQKTLTRLKALAKGNDMDPESIQIVESQESVYTVRGTITLTPKVTVKVKDSLGRLKAKSGRLLPSFAALQQEIDRLQQEQQSADGWVDMAIAELKKTPGHGWGFHQGHVSWSDRETILTATENCPACRGAAQHPCTACQGIGTQICSYCEGRGQEYCPYCGGRGTDTNNPQAPCPHCHGTSYMMCRYCHGNRRSNCDSCHGKGQIPCADCKGTGTISREARVSSGADLSFGFESSSTLPSGLLRAMQRIGEDRLHEGHGDITLIPPEEKEEDAKKRNAPQIRLEAKVPFADIKMKFGTKGALVSCFGKKARLSGVPPFLDHALSPARGILTKAAAGALPLDQALKPRAMQDALKLVLTGQSHPNKLRQKYPVGLSEQVAKEIMKNMAAAIKHETSKSRSVSAAVCVIISLAALAGWLFTPLYAQTQALLGPQGTLGLDIIAPLFTLGATWAVLRGAAHSSLKRRFPSAQVAKSAEIGKRGYAALAIIGIGYATMRGAIMMGWV